MPILAVLTYRWLIRSRSNEPDRARSAIFLANKPLKTSELSLSLLSFVPLGLSYVYNLRLFVSSSREHTMLLDKSYFSTELCKLCHVHSLLRFVVRFFSITNFVICNFVRSLDKEIYNKEKSGKFS